MNIFDRLLRSRQHETKLAGTRSAPVSQGSVLVRDPDMGGGVTIETKQGDFYVTRGDGVFALDPAGGEGWTIINPEIRRHFVELADLARPPKNSDSALVLRAK